MQAHISIYLLGKGLVVEITEGVIRTKIMLEIWEVDELIRALEEGKAHLKGQIH